MKAINKKSVAIRAAFGLLLLFSCFFMYDFYKCLSGFIANGFREPLVMLPMILAYLLPVVCFLFSFYDCFVKAIRPAVKTAYSAVKALYAAADLVLIFCNLPLYSSNSALGTYDALPSIILRFPYDMIVILSLILISGIFDLVMSVRKECSYKAFIDGLKDQGTLSIGRVEYSLICIPGIFAFVFTGSAITACFTAIENALYDVRYVFLLLWVMLIPLMNILVLALKPERMRLTSRARLLLLAFAVGLNLVFGALFLAAELTYPDFLVHIGKPLFLIAFSVSLPIEPVIIFAIMLLGTAVSAVRIGRLIKGKY